MSINPHKFSPSDPRPPASPAPPPRKSEPVRPVEAKKKEEDSGVLGLIGAVAIGSLLLGD